MVLNPMPKQVEMLTAVTMTMAVDDNDPTPFIPITTTQLHKIAKPHPNPVDKVYKLTSMDSNKIPTKNMIVSWPSSPPSSTSCHP